MRSIDIWRNGVPLSEAEEVFPPSSFGRRYRREQAKNTGLASLSEAQRGNQPKDRTFAIATMQDELSKRSALSGIRGEAREWLMRQLADGRLRAFGYRRESLADGDPVEIPPYMFNVYFANWEASSLKGLDQEFVGVRVISAQEVPEESSATDRDTPRERPGAPTQRALIDAAIEALAVDEVPFGQGGGKEKAELVRRRVELQTGRDVHGKRGFGNETINRRIKNYEKQQKSR